jgi:hypothetical protein
MQVALSRSRSTQTSRASDSNVVTRLCQVSLSQTGGRRAKVSIDIHKDSVITSAAGMCTARRVAVG